MSQDFQVAKFRQSLLTVFTCSAVGAASLWLLNIPSQLASAQALGSIDPTQSLNRAAGVVSQAQEMPSSQDPAAASQQTPSEIPEIQVDDDPTGKIATYQPGGTTVTADNAFFQNLGTNGRTCFTCHQPQNGWTISAAGAQARFAASSGTDPLFRQIDGATCSTDPIATLEQRQQAFQLLTGKGLIRIFIQLPPNQFTSNMEFTVSKVDDPYNCTTNPATGLARNKKSGSMSMYRRPLPATNLGFLKDIAIMWDGREPNLAQQSIDATVGHAEAKKAPSSEQQDQIVAFETGIFTAQVFDNGARGLNAHGAKGGPVALSQELANFYIGINDPLGSNPKGTPFNQKIFDLYKAPGRSNSQADGTQQRNSIARGEFLFNTTQINITGVTGLNDVLGMGTIPGFCGTCHDTPNVGNHSVKAPLNIGVANAGANAPPALDISGLPVFTLKCIADPLAGQTFVVTDPGRALITGKCSDIGKVKGPVLRGLAARAPYFHNGSAATLMDVVNFYNLRFNIGFTDQQKQDLVNFLNAL
jgi:cytochrome c peroxidase